MNGQGKNRLNQKQVCDESEIDSEIRFASRIASARCALSNAINAGIAGAARLSLRNSARIHVVEWKPMEMPHQCPESELGNFCRALYESLTGLCGSPRVVIMTRPPVEEISDALR